MRAGTPGFEGSRLREARESRGLTAVSLAEVVGVTPQSISLYEHGRSSPSPEVMEKLAATLNMPAHFFTLPPRETESNAIFYRSMSSATKGARRRAERRFSWLQDLTRLVSEYVALPDSALPDLDLPEDPNLLSDTEIEAAADEARKQWGMWEGPIGNMVALLENHGALISRDTLGAESLDSLSEYSEEEGRAFIILGTDKGTAVRWRFDAAHELGHLLMHRYVDQRQLARPPEFKRIEEQAHRFAAAFLLPLGSFADDFFAASLDALRAIKPKWKVSIGMMIKRARHAELISEDAERRLWISYSRQKWRRAEPYDDSIAVEEPRLLRRALELILEKGIQTPADIVTRLGLPTHDVEKLAGFSPGYLSRDFAPVRVLDPGRGISAGEEEADADSGEVIQLPSRPGNPEQSG